MYATEVRVKESHVIDELRFGDNLAVTPVTHEGLSRDVANTAQLFFTTGRMGSQRDLH